MSTNNSSIDGQDLKGAGWDFHLFKRLRQSSLLTLAAFKVAMQLLDDANENWVAYRSVRNMARITRLGRATVHKSLQHLAAVGFIQPDSLRWWADVGMVQLSKRPSRQSLGYLLHREWGLEMGGLAEHCRVDDDADCHRRGDATVIPTRPNKNIEKTTDKLKDGAAPKVAAASEINLERARTNPIQPAPYDDPRLCDLVGLCQDLRGQTGDQPFRLSQPVVARLFEVQVAIVRQWIARLTGDGWIVLVQRGGCARNSGASKFRWGNRAMRRAVCELAVRDAPDEDDRTDYANGEPPGA